VKLALGILAILAGELAWMFATVPDFLSKAPGGDYPFYVEMAATPLTTTVPSPWRYRVLNPWLASLLVKSGLPVDVAFLLLTAVFAFASSMTMRLYLRRLSLSTFTANAGAVLFAISIGGYVPLRRYYGYTDALTNFLILIVLVSAITWRPVVTAALLGVGTLAKESLLLLLPFIGERGRAARMAWPRLAMVVAVPIAVFVLLRLIVGMAGESPVALSWESQVAYWRTAMVHGAVRWLLWSIAYSMGPLWLLALLAVPRQWRFVGTALWLLLPLIAPLVRTTDTERALLLAFPVVLPLAVSLLDECRSRAGQLTLIVVTCAAALGGQLTFDWVSPPGLGFINAKDVVFATLCILPATLAVWLRGPGLVARLAWPLPLNRP
jgi:hypothetical protein